MSAININVAEKVIEPFWDRQISGIRKWRMGNIKQDETSTPWWDQIPESIYSKEPIFHVKSEDGKGVWLKETWSQLEFGCEVADGTALKMERDFGMECSGYDHLILCGLIPPKTTLVLTAITDQGTVTKKFNASEHICKKEYILPICASLLIRVVIEVLFADDCPGEGFFHWLMLQNTQLEKAYVRSLTVEDKNWEPYLKDSSYQPKFKPFLNITADENTIGNLRQNKELVTNICEKAYAMKEPEEIVSDYVNLFRDRRFTRERDYHKSFDDVENIATAALLAKDAELMRKAARYALAIASCRFWQDSFMCRSTGLLFDHKAFVESVCCRTISTIIDLAGEMFTNAGIQFLLRRLCEEGIANINWVIWKYSKPPEDIFSINQVAWFSSGRLPAYVVVEKFWPRIRAYTDLAYKELCESINRIVLKDGGYDEGSGYFVAVAKFACTGFYWYAKSRGLSLTEVIPDSLKRTSDFAECVLSLDESFPFIPVGDSHLEQLHAYSVLAALMPKSHWTTIFRRLWKEHGSECADLLTLQLEKTIPAQYDWYRPYIVMPEWGAVSSVRELHGEKLKLFQYGGNAGANHAHADKGSFVMQFAGETIFADPGIGAYDDYIGSSMGKIEWHNMLIPLRKGAIMAPNPPTEDVKPLSQGDYVGFYSKIDLSCCWKGILKNCSRELISSQPDILIMNDSYSLDNADSVMLNFVTPLKVQIIDDMVVINGKRCYVTIKPDKTCRIELKQLPKYKGIQYTRIIMIREEVEGTIHTEIRCCLNKKE